jgi:hypothetical protein
MTTLRQATARSSRATGKTMTEQRKVLSLRTGKEVNYARPPKATTRVRWSKNTTGGKPVTGTFRHICHLNDLNNRAKARFGREIEILQSAYNTTVPASKGTHDYDGVVDLYIPGVDWWTQQRFLRRNGLGSWYRYPPKFGHHIHGLTLPPREGVSISDDFAVHGFKVGVYVPGQLYDYYKHAFGLKDMHTPGSDKSWYPKAIEATIFDLNGYVTRQKARQARKRRKPA